MANLIPRKKDGTFQKGFISPWRNGENRLCKCGRTFYVQGYRLSDIKRGKFCSSECSYKASQGKRKSIATEFKKDKNLGEEHRLWKGNNVGYYALHAWIIRHYGKAKKCVNGHIAKMYVWANISGEYRRDLSDWHELCQSCNLTDGIKINRRFLLLKN